MIVVKAGGRALASNMNNILDSLASRASEEVVFVHGGGDIVSEYERRLGIEPKIVTSPSGIRSRFTDENELEVYVMVMARLGKKMSAYLNWKGVKTVSIAGVDAGLVRAKRKKKIVVVDERGRKRIIDGGYTGTITSVDAEAIRTFLKMNYLLLISPIALGDEGEMLNVDGDSIAAAIASAVKADALYFLTDVDGVFVGGQVVRKLSAKEARDLIDKIGPGMNRKVLMAVEAVENGVKKVHICSGLGQDPLREADEGLGTVFCG